MATIAPPGLPLTPPVIASLPQEERFAAMHQTMIRLLEETGRIADAIRNEGTVVVTGVADEIDPEASPIRTKGMAEHFVITNVDDGSIQHPLYCFVMPEHPDRIDPSPQFHLYEMLGHIRAVNIFCQEANEVGALCVALQSPRLPAKIDRILALAGAYAAYFDTLAVSQSFVAPAPGKARGKLDLEAMKLSVDRHKLMAADRAVVPERFEAHLPTMPWPLLGLEVARRPESGHRLMHGVYFPAEFARQLMAKEARALEPALAA